MSRYYYVCSKVVVGGINFDFDFLGEKRRATSDENERGRIRNNSKNNYND